MIFPAHIDFLDDNINMETNDIKDQFVQEYQDGKSPTLSDYVNKYPQMDIEEFLDWGLELAMFEAQAKFLQNRRIQLIKTLARRSGKTEIAHEVIKYLLKMENKN